MTERQAITIDPATGRKRFDTRAAANPRVQGSGYNVVADTELTTLPEQPAGATFDDEARARYRADKQQRAGSGDFISMEGDLRRYLVDHYSADPVPREALTDECEVLIVGAGFSGLLLWYRLRAAGFDDVRVCERGGDVGGTWYWNRYPGCMCDVESYTYLPLLEETGFMPTEKYASAPEIFRYCQTIGEHFDLYPHAIFQTEVADAAWDEGTGRWTITTSRDDTITTKFFVTAGGILHKAKLPGIAGIEEFEGHAFHTSRWDYGYTGGSPTEPMDKLADKRVGIVGTGATAVQVVPHVGASAKQTYVFQRTPSSIFERHNKATDPEWVKTLEPGWQQERMDNFNLLVSGQTTDEDLVQDHWTDTLRMAAQVIEETGVDPATLSSEQLSELYELGDMKKMEGVRSRVEQLVCDPTTAEALKPYYRLWCKRPCFDADYLDTFNRPNVQLVDTHGRGVDRITENAVVVDGIGLEE